MRQWVEPPELPVSDELIHLTRGSPLVAKELVRRGYTTLASARAFIDPEHYAPSPPQVLPGMDLAVERLKLALRKGERILVWGDFDVDGQTATAILVDSLRDLGGKASYHVPIRAQESHGISLPVLRRIMDEPENAPAVILTCDTGISAFESLEYARSCGVDVIVTDHHELPRQKEGVEPAYRLPPAFCIVTPRNLPAGHPLEGLPGAGVAYKLAEALYHRFGDASKAEMHLDLVALGIVADVALQTNDTRYLLQRGLRAINLDRRTGLSAIFERAGLSAGNISEEQIGFSIGPRLNALGRLSDANAAVKLLTTRDMGMARRLALELEGWNIRRQLLTRQVLRGALAKIDANSSLRERPLLVLAHEGWEAGVIGIVASRLVELYGKPAALISVGSDGVGRGSARSIEGVDIIAAIAEQSNLLLGFGGHRMAAGFSVEQENIPVFQRGLELSVEEQLAGKMEIVRELVVSAYVKWDELNLEMAQAFELLAPFGSGNPPVVLATDHLSVKSSSTFGRQQEHLRLVIEDEKGLSRNVIWWGGGEMGTGETLPLGKFRLAYTLRAGNARGKPELNLVLEDFKRPDTAISIRIDQPRMAYQDFRRSEKPVQQLNDIIEKQVSGSLMVWVEGEALGSLRSAIVKKNLRGGSILLKGREGLAPCETLLIWTPPPGLNELFEGLRRAAAEKVVFFANETGTDQIFPFLKRLSGLVKHILSTQAGNVDLKQLASSMAQSEQLVMAGLYWLAARGFITIETAAEEISKSTAVESQTENALSIRKDGIADPDQVAFLEKQIIILLQETRAFHSYYLRMDLEKELSVIR